MSVAASLGVEENAHLLEASDRRWAEWVERERMLAEAGRPRELPEHLRAHPEQVDGIFRALIRLAGVGEKDAATFVCWLLVPGAGAIASRYRHLHQHIDDLTVGHLWLTVVEASPEARGPIHRVILRNTERRLQGELGVGDGARRNGNRTWSESVPTDPTLLAPNPTASSDDALTELLELFEGAVNKGAITVDDAQLLYDLATTADEIHRVAGRPNRKGGRRAGLTSHEACELVGRRRSLSRASISRRATAALHKLSEFAADECLAA